MSGKATFVDFEFNKDAIPIQKYKYAINWPVVYILEDGKRVYIGETNGLKARVNQHLDDPLKKGLKYVHSFSSDTYNKSAILDLEAKLINLFAGDDKFTVMNGTLGSSKHEYYNKTFYENQINSIWETLQKKKLANQDIFLIENSDLFKFSPYKSLSEEQMLISDIILDRVENESTYLSFIEGNPGTGKTILGMYLLKKLKDLYPKKKIGFVVPMDSLRATLKTVAKSINGLYMKDIMAPGQVQNEMWDILIVDEAHRLKRAVNLSSGFVYKSHYNLNVKLGLDEHDGDQLDWILTQSYHQIMFYDSNQSVKPTDVPFEKFLSTKIAFDELNATQTFSLTDQHRIKGGNKYINYMNGILDCNVKEKISLDNYTVRLIDDFDEFNSLLYEKEIEDGLTRMVSGYYVPWISEKDKTQYDFNIGTVRRQWNHVSTDWPNSEGALDQVGCIHTIQGYDLNNAFVIIGKEIDYDSNSNEMVINPLNYFDKKGKNGIKNQSDLKKYILNIYRTLLTRGIRGVYIYACNPNMKTYLRQFFD